MAIGELCGVFDGTHQTPKYVEEGVPFVSVENVNNLAGTSKFISAEDFQKNYKVKPKRGDIFMTRIGTIGMCSAVESDDPLAYYVTLALLRPNQTRLHSRFLKLVIESEVGARALRKKTLTSAVPIKINLGDIGKIIIPVPQIEEQERIVDMLDKFDSLLKDLSIGLPAELAARRKQYEYYRDKLLTFEEAVA